MVFEKDAFFLFVDVEGHTAEVAAFECVDKGRGIDEFTAAGIDEKGSSSHAGHGFGFDEIAGLWGER